MFYPIAVRVVNHHVTSFDSDFKIARELTVSLPYPSRRVARRLRPQTLRDAGSGRCDTVAPRLESSLIPSIYRNPTSHRCVISTRFERRERLVKRLPLVPVEERHAGAIYRTHQLTVRHWSVTSGTRNSVAKRSKSHHLPNAPVRRLVRRRQRPQVRHDVDELEWRVLNISFRAFFIDDCAHLRRIAARPSCAASTSESCARPSCRPTADRRRQPGKARLLGSPKSDFLAAPPTCIM